MTRFSVMALCFLGCAISSGTQAQTNTDPLPNPLQRGNVAATCANLPEMMQAADPQAMQRITGVWDSTGVIPGTPGMVSDTQIQARSQIDANGGFQLDQYGCFQTFNVDGSPMAPSCATSSVYGNWTAHFAPDGSIVMVTLSSGSGFTGGVLPMSCGVSYLRVQDANTLIDSSGNILHRAG
jgi:hypothetical protein